MRGRKHSEDVATEPYAARVDDANETKPSSRKKTFSANLCSQNWWRYTLHQSDLFAGKMHAILFRAWKGRVKGRDWYDLIWYIQNKIPLSLSYLEKCMKQAGNLAPQEPLNRQKLMDLLQARIQKIDWESAKSDIHPFISDPEKLEIWSSQFFSDLIEHLLIE